LWIGRVDEWGCGRVVDEREKGTKLPQSKPGITTPKLIQKIQQVCWRARNFVKITMVVFI